MDADVLRFSRFVVNMPSGGPVQSQSKDRCGLHCLRDQMAHVLPSP